MEIQRLGERKLIALIRSMYGYGWPDSDSSYIDFGSRRILVTTDSITASTHIPEGADPADAGYFFAAINLSDIAAMGGTPRYFMSSLILPPRLDTRYLMRMQTGIRKCLSRYGVRVIGGDLKKGAELAMTGIAIGEVRRHSMMSRMNVRRGDALCVTGELGGNAAGYYLWKNGSASGIRRLLRVEPRIAEGRFLSANGVRAAIDLSDGVYSAVSQIGFATGLGFEIDYSSLPVSDDARKASEECGVSMEQLCLNFGGEYELLFAVSESKLGSLKRKAASAGIRITRIGTVKGNRSFLVRDGRRSSISKRGYEHFITD